MVKRIIAVGGLVIALAAGALFVVDWNPATQAEAIAACSCGGKALGSTECRGGKKWMCRENQTDVCTWEPTYEPC